MFNLQKITTFTQKIEALSAEQKFFYWLTSKYYDSVVKREIKLAGITKDDNILCIGGGLCPFSAVLLHQTTGAKVTVIDNNEACAKKAQEVIDRLGLQPHVTVRCEDGASLDFPLAPFSIVHLALQVFPMNQVFAQVEAHVNPGTKILVRRPRKCLNKLYSQWSNSVIHCCQQIFHKRLRNIGRTQLYIKKEGSL